MSFSLLLRLFLGLAPVGQSASPVSFACEVLAPPAALGHSVLSARPKSYSYRACDDFQRRFEKNRRRSGLYIVHFTFGRGLVLNFIRQDDGNAKLVVHFENYGDPKVLCFKAVLDKIVIDEGPRETTGSSNEKSQARNAESPIKAPRKLPSRLPYDSRIKEAIIEAVHRWTPSMGKLTVPSMAVLLGRNRKTVLRHLDAVIDVENSHRLSEANPLRPPLKRERGGVPAAAYSPDFAASHAMDLSAWAPWVALRESEPHLPMTAGEDNTVIVGQRLQLWARRYHSSMAGMLQDMESTSYQWMEKNQSSKIETFERTLGKFSRRTGAPAILLRSGYTPSELAAWLIPRLPMLPRHVRMQSYRQLSGKSLTEVADAIGLDVDELRDIESGKRPGFHRPTQWPAYAKEVGCPDIFLLLKGVPKAEALTLPLSGPEWFEMLRMAYGKRMEDLQPYLGVSSMVLKRWTRRGPEGITPSLMVDALDGKLGPNDVRATFDAYRTGQQSRRFAWHIAMKDLIESPELFQNAVQGTLKLAEWAQKIPSVTVNALHKSVTTFSSMGFIAVTQSPRRHNFAPQFINVTPQALAWYEKNYPENVNRLIHLRPFLATSS